MRRRPETAKIGVKFAYCDQCGFTYPLDEMRKQRVILTPQNDPVAVLLRGTSTFTYDDDNIAQHAGFVCPDCYNKPRSRPRKQYSEL